MTAPHLDDELLSAHLDGEAVEVEGVEHLAGCAECAARLAALARVASAVGAAVAPPSDDRRQAAIEAAIEAAIGARVLPLQARRRRLTVLAAAAAVVVVLGSVAVRWGDDGAVNGTHPVALRDQSGPTFEGGDLGDQSDTAELALRLRAAVEPEGGSTAGGTAAEAGSAPDAATDAAVPTEAPAAAKAAPSGQRSFTSADPDCTRTATRDFGTGLGALVYRASLRWEGTSAVVLVYSIEGATGPLDHRVLVMARGDCRLLVAQTI